MKDRFHGSAQLLEGRDGAYCDTPTPVVKAYRGSSARERRRGVARTTPPWIRRASGHRHRRTARIVLEVQQSPAIPCWSGRADGWLERAVPTAYHLRYDTHVRTLMPHNPVSLKAVLAVAKARAFFADHRTGRDCRPANATLANATGLSVRTVRRASTALRLLGVATEVVRGRQRTRTERFASWRVGDRGRGWASVWALHDSRFLPLSSHPGGSPVREKPLVKRTQTTHPAGVAGRPPGDPTHRQRRRRRSAADPEGLELARQWRSDRRTPPWARRHTTHGWSSTLAALHRAGWEARDINVMIQDWALAHWIPDHPHRPIGLLRAMIAAHGDLANRPADIDRAQAAADAADRRERQATAQKHRHEATAARAAGREALNSTGHALARQIAADAARRGAARQRAGRFAESIAEMTSATIARR